MQIFDVTDPTNISTTPVGEAVITNPRGLDVAGRYAYCSESDNDAFVVFDVIDKANPVEVGRINNIGGLNASPRGVQVRGNIAFVTNNSVVEGFIAIDVTDPTNPVEISSASTTVAARTEFDVLDDVAYVSTLDANNSIILFDVSDPYTSMPRLVTLALGSGSSVRAVRVQGRYLYAVTENDRKLRIFDVSDPANTSTTPVGEVVLTASGTQSPRVVDVQGNFAYIASASNPLFQVVDISDPTAPVLISTDLSLGTNPISIAVSGRYAYVTDNSADILSVLDVSGIDAQNLNVGSIDSGNINVRRDLVAAGRVSGNSAVFGFGGVYSDGQMAFRGFPAMRLPGSVVEVTNDNAAAELAALQPGVTYLLMEPITFSGQINVPTNPGAFDFLPAVITTDAKYSNILTSSGSGGALIPTQQSASQSGQLTLRGVRIENTGSRIFADMKGDAQTSMLLEMDNADIVGFDTGTTFDNCALITLRNSFWTDSGLFRMIDIDADLDNTFNFNSSDTNAPIISIESSSGASTTCTVSVNSSEFSSQNNESIFFLHSNIISGSTILIRAVERNPFTPKTGDFFGTTTGNVTALADSGTNPGTHTTCTATGHSVADGDTVTLSGFVTQTQYNQSYVASNVVDAVSFDVGRSICSKRHRCMDECRAYSS